MSGTGIVRTTMRRHRAGSARSVSIDRLEAALLKVAHLVARDPTFTPVFERLEAEIEKAKEVEDSLSDAQQRARDLLARYTDRNA